MSTMNINNSASRQHIPSSSERALSDSSGGGAFGESLLRPFGGTAKQRRSPKRIASLSRRQSCRGNTAISSRDSNSAGFSTSLHSQCVKSASLKLADHSEQNWPLRARLTRWIVDRKKDLIKVNGLPVAPAELEADILEHEDVADAVVAGITAHGGELPRAYVVLQDGVNDKTTAKDIQDFVSAKGAKHKQLTAGVKFVGEIPRLASGKIMRKIVREWARRDSKEVECTIKAKI